MILTPIERSLPIKRQFVGPGFAGGVALGVTETDGTGVLDTAGVTDIPGVREGDGVPVSVILGVTETDGTGVFDTTGVTDGVDVTLIDTGILLGVTLGVTEIDGTGVVVIDGVTDGVAVTLGDNGTTRTGHSSVQNQHGSSSSGFSTVTNASRVLGQSNLTVILPVKDVSIVG